ncbi:hypothetical protein BY458DRAFT_523648 [Sporodiniella umbellata]|nr:hypothetical protein BY458DRAFT_523648 [Sporodiniella umbellata]
MTSQISLFNDRLQQQLEALQLEYQRYNSQRADYEALNNLLSTLPDTTTKPAMIPIGKLAFMPGKIIHTNEILAYLGDQYYAERSTKQAMEILSRKKKHVSEKLGLLSNQIEDLKSKTKSLLDTGLLSEAQFNEEGLPIMEIREEWPEEPEEAKKVEITKKKATETALPPSVQRARDMMDRKADKIEESENKALFDMLRNLEKEEQDEEGEEESEAIQLHQAQKKPWLKQINQSSDQEENEEEENDSDDDDDDDRYDRELDDDIFNKFAEEEDDEAYPLDNIVDQDDFTFHDQEVPYEKSTPDVITKPKFKQEEGVIKEVPEKTPELPLKQAVVEKVTESASIPEEPTSKKKMSKFKLLKQKERKKVTFQLDKDKHPEPTENESSQVPIKEIKSAHDIARTIHMTAPIVDDYPSLDVDSSSLSVDLNQLIKVAKGVQEPFYRPSDGAMVPLPKENLPQQNEGIIIAKKSNMDNKIMKGSVMERETVDVDLDELEEDMDLREITTRYHERRQQMLASTGSLSFDQKPEFEVFDEDLPLPKKHEEEKVEEEEEEVVPKKMSRFKAARLGVKDY